jgi:hypothetical protein
LRGNLGLPIPENRHTRARREQVAVESHVDADEVVATV